MKLDFEKAYELDGVAGRRRYCRRTVRLDLGAGPFKMSDLTAVLPTIAEFLNGRGRWGAQGERSGELDLEAGGPGGETPADKLAREGAGK